MRKWEFWYKLGSISVPPLTRCSSELNKFWKPLGLSCIVRAVLPMNLADDGVVRILDSTILAIIRSRRPSKAYCIDVTFTIVWMAIFRRACKIIRMSTVLLISVFFFSKVILYQFSLRKFWNAQHSTIYAIYIGVFLFLDGPNAIALRTFPVTMGFFKDLMFIKFAFEIKVLLRLLKITS